MELFGGEAWLAFKKEMCFFKECRFGGRGHGSSPWGLYAGLLSTFLDLGGWGPALEKDL